MSFEVSADSAFEFGFFQFLPRRRLLLRDGSPLSLGGRAMDLLYTLIERAGEPLSRQEIESRVWPGRVVEETSLRVHVSSLRRALQDGIDGARYITNVRGRGYCFVAPVTRVGRCAATLPTDRIGLFETVRDDRSDAQVPPARMWADAAAAREIGAGPMRDGQGAHSAVLLFFVDIPKGSTAAGASAAMSEALERAGFAVQAMGPTPSPGASGWLRPRQAEEGAHLALK